MIYKIKRFEEFIVVIRPTKDVEKKIDSILKRGEIK